MVLDATQDGEAASFRVIPSRLPVVENNLAIANLSFDELRSAVDSDGVYRGSSPEQAPAPERKVRLGELLEAVNRATHSAIARQLREDLKQRVAPVLTAAINEDLRSTYNDMSGQPYRPELTIGLTEMREFLAKGGRAYGIHLPLLDSYWTISWIQPVWICKPP